MVDTAVSMDPATMSAEDKAAVLGTLERLIASPHFRKSKRYPALLEYSVRCTLGRDLGALKERTIGMEVFGRSAEYDTNDDPIVRVAAGEVRKRLAQYFNEHRDCPVQIDLPSGSYVSEFSFREEETADDTIPMKPVQHAAADHLLSTPHFPPLPVYHLPYEQKDRHPGRSRYTIPLCLVAVLLMAAVGLSLRQNILNRRDFWGPVLNGPRPSVILIGLRQTPPARTPVANAAPSDITPSTPVPEYRSVLSNTIAVADVCAAFSKLGKACDIASSRVATFADIRGKSIILIGTFDNPWTDRLLTPLRYQFTGGPDVDEALQHGVRYIVDRTQPSQHSTWFVDFNRPHGQLQTDYFIVGRFMSETTESPVVVAAGIGPHGTRSAAELLSSPERMAEILAAAPHGWAGFNFEAVFQTEVIQGHTGHAKLMASYFW